MPATPLATASPVSNGVESATAVMRPPLKRWCPGAPAPMPVDLYWDPCHSAGYSFAGVEWSQECYCGNAPPTEVATEGTCDMVCNGEFTSTSNLELALTMWGRQPS